MGAPGILVNNAGITRDTLMLRMDDDQWNQVIAVNLTGAYNMTKACLKGMMKARWGRVINISSVIGLHGGAGQANYAAAKAGLVGLTLSTAKEVGSRGITANVIAPGFIETDMTSDLPEAMMESVTKTAPIGRLGTPSDVAPVICFLASDLASYITGQVISVDGGLYL
jgi:3-oxoacyl-[acyl-carrier protein] reductase